MKSIFFMDIDTQRDFLLPSGALYVPGAERIIPKLRRLFDFARKNDVFVVSSVDAHEAGDPEFAQFPPHCVKGTEGQQKVNETLFPRPFLFENREVDKNLLDIVRKYPQVILQKQALDVFSNPMTGKLIRALPKHAFVFGVATDYCVKHACVGLRRAGVQTVLVSDAVRAITPQSGDAALDDMRREGVEAVTLEAMLKILSD